MSVARKRRRYLALSRYAARVAYHDQRRSLDELPTVRSGSAILRASKPFYRNRARFPYGWQAPLPLPRLISHGPVTFYAGSPGQCGLEYACGTVLDGFDSITAAEAVGCGHRSKRDPLPSAGSALGAVA